MNVPKIGIVIPVFNRINLTIQCIESLKNIIYSNFEIIIIDDGSTDGTSDIIRRDYPYVVILEGDGSLWWSKSTNVGIKKAINDNCQYVLFLNNDDVVDKLILQNLVKCACENPGAIIGCKVYDFDQPDKLIFAGGDCDWKNKGLFRYGYGEIDSGQYNNIKEIKWIPGAGTFVHVDVFKNIGFIDDKSFPQYRADIDFTLRAYEAGCKVLLEHSAILYRKDDFVGLPSKNSLRKVIDKLVLPLFSKRSQMNLKLEVLFLLKHCPAKYLLKWLFHRYYSYYRSYFKLDVIRRYLGVKQI